MGLILRRYTDDGYQTVEWEYALTYIQVGNLVDVLYNKGLINADDVQAMMFGSDIEVIEQK